MCLNYTALLARNNNNVAQSKLDNQNCMMLNAAPTPYFDGGLIKMIASGRFSYMCTRNNNFSNRSQKGLLIVTGGQFNAASTAVFSVVLLLLTLIVSLF